MGKKVFISYIDDNDKSVDGWFDEVNIFDSFVVIKSDKNEITIPSNRLKKIKRGLK